jgi:hypothetical protein
MNPQAPLREGRHNKHGATSAKLKREPQLPGGAQLALPFIQVAPTVLGIPLRAPDAGIGRHPGEVEAERHIASPRGFDLMLPPGM